MKINASRARLASFGAPCLAVALALTTAACDQPQASANAAAATAAPPEISFITVRQEPVPLVRELPGRVTARSVAEVRARVSGLVVKRAFEQGSKVNEGDLLYKIDPAPYQVELARSEAALQRAEASLVLARQQAERLSTLLARHIASQAQYDAAIAAQKQAEAEVAGARAARDGARLNLEYTNVRAPISGRIGRALLTEGTLLDSASSGVLATIQQIDPIYVDITQSVGELNKLRRDLASGELARLEGNGANVELIMDDGSVYAHNGRLLFSDITADPGTGQVTLRVLMPNPDGELFPGMYVRARVAQGVDADAIAVPQQAVHRSNDGRAEVWVVKADNKVALQPVDVGQVVGGAWLVNAGLQPGERVVVEGVQKISAGMEVKPVALTPAARQASLSGFRAPGAAREARGL
ncbi:efflux RND transporter periplasmic adaptor subunit [Camelimonas lactis]|uniref:Membrane fusion protein (Multidrug efflux system) n=1 Tax=Camelimonas lactis TaxID=659006 RepID=A0A4R2GSR6_9HYPH|nr:efflux RND transporter periplasmic adaptor subunit [Camelimonas lactis]TCO13094.1 membrane fusion protein (multidrug efflux system) [Camelimonas lactis]